MNKEANISPDVFNILEDIQDIPLVYVYKTGLGMFNDASTKILNRAGVKSSEFIIYSLDFNNHSTAPIIGEHGFYLKLINDRFYFILPDMALNLSRISRKINGIHEFYCAALNPTVFLSIYNEKPINRLVLYNMYELTYSIEFAKPHRIKQRERYRAFSNKIMNILSINEDTYNEWLFNSAFEYLNDISENNAWAVSKLTTFDSFWQWWKVQYHILDEVLVNEYSELDIAKINIEELRSHYYKRHATLPILLENYLYVYLNEEDRKEQLKHDKV
jgi:hypothetical protein